MATVSYPGVYMEEVSSGVRPIVAASTSTAAFVGLTEMGPTDEAKRITNWTEFQKHYGTFIDGSYMAESVYQFFSNGGSQCYIVRITKNPATGAGSPAKASVTVKNRATGATTGVTFTAKNEGTWGNSLCLQIEDGTDDPGNTFKLSIRRQKVADIVPEKFLTDVAPLEVFDNLSMDPESNAYVEKVLENSSYLIDAKVEDVSSLQSGIHYGGFGPAVPVFETGVPAGTKWEFRINVDHDGFQTVQLDAFAAGATLANVASAIQTAVRALTKQKTSTAAEAFSQFTCAVGTVVEDAVTKTRLVLQSGTNRDAVAANEAEGIEAVVHVASNTSYVLIQNGRKYNVAGTLKLGGGFGGLSEGAFAIRRPLNADTFQVGDNEVVTGGPVAGVVSGSDGTNEPEVTDFKTKFHVLDKITDFSLLAVPDGGSTDMVDAGMGYCRNRPLQDVFYIGEMTQDDDEPDDALSFRKQLTEPNSYGAVYFPWILALDPSGRSAEPVKLPPSGYVAGLYARIDGTRGVWKAPAGTEATLSGAKALTINLTDIEQGNLNRINVNCIRRFASSGIVSWGARTITSDPEWTYVPVRRMAIMLRVSIYNGIQWAVFEPNDEELWGQLRMNLTSFMMTLYRKGAFQGSSPSQAFFVKCDSETTTQDDINLGIVNVLVGFAPLKPAEFVVVKISQKAGQAS
jgi:phage tail sheath protein FI